MDVPRDQDTHESTEPKKRRKSSARRQLEEAVKQFDDCLRSQELKDSKRADVITEKTGILKILFQAETDEKRDEALFENERLKKEHEADAATIEELRTRISELEPKTREVKTVTVPDPEAAQIKELNSALSDLLKLLASGMTSDDEKLKMAVRVLQSCPESAAKVFLPMLGLDYKQHAGMMLNYKTEWELRNIVERAVNGDGQLSRFARARLAVNYPTKTVATSAKNIKQAFVPDTRSAEEKIAEAKAMTHQQRWGA